MAPCKSLFAFAEKHVFAILLEVKETGRGDAKGQIMFTDELDGLVLIVVW